MTLVAATWLGTSWPGQEVFAVDYTDWVILLFLLWDRLFGPSARVLRSIARKFREAKEREYYGDDL